MNINAALGPTNTGKTFYAIERMTSYQSGIIGLPLRLLTKEVFDKIWNIFWLDFIISYYLLCFCKPKS